jgi:hypothetical protein
MTYEKYWYILGKLFREIKYNYIIMEQFLQYLKESQLAKSTITNHKRELNNFLELGGDLQATEKEIMAMIKANYYEGSSQKTIITSVSKYRTYKELPNTMIRQMLKKSQEVATKEQQQKTTEIMNTMPPLSEFRALMGVYHHQKMWKQYIALYLLLNLNTRNQDLVLNITSDPNEVDDEQNWLYVRKHSVVYFRNNYKTVSDYGKKRDFINSKKFADACRNINNLLIDDGNLDRQVKRITGGVNQSTLFKVVVANKNCKEEIADIKSKSVTKLSKNRGTSVQTIEKNYVCN